MPRKNPLLRERLKDLLTHKDVRGSYNPVHMYEALRKRTPKEIRALTLKEREERLEFIAITREEMEALWLRRFFEKQQDREFKSGAFAVWLADNIDFSDLTDLASPLNFAYELVSYALIIVVSFANKGFIERVPSVTNDTYRIAFVDGNPLLEDLRIEESA